MPSENLVICYEAIQRVYRNAVVKFLRAQMTRAFGAAAPEKLRAPFPKEWETIKRSANAPRLSGELGTAITDDFDLLSVNHFFNLFDVYYGTLCAVDAEMLEDDKKRGKAALLHWIKQVKGLRDPLSHPPEEDFSREDSFVLLDCARRVLLRLKLTEAATQVRDMMDGLFATDEELLLDREREPLDDRLPPRNSIVVQFVGREKELTQLREWFSDPVSRRWALAGEGGKGKSALAFNFAFEVKLTAPPPFQTVVWLSAKRRQFIEGQIVSIAKPDFYDLNSALACILSHYGWVEDLETPTETRRARVLELLSQLPALLVLDDVDSLDRSNEDVIEFFALQVPTTSSKVLFTSRQTIFGLGNVTTHVGGLTEADAKQFIKSRCELMELDVAIFDSNTVKRIIRTTDGSPLYIEDLMRLTATIRSASEAIKIWEEKGGRDARRYALGREWDCLNRDARGVLVAACVCPGAVPFTLIEEMTGFSADRVAQALNELQKLFLLPKPKLIEDEQRFEVNLNTRALVRECYGSSPEYRKIAETYSIISRGVPETARGDVGASIRQAFFLSRANKSPDAEKTLLAALGRKPNNPDLLGVLGRVYQEWRPPRITDAREQFRRAAQLKCSRSETYEQWCCMELDQGEWRRAAEAAEWGLRLVPTDRTLLYLAGFARHRLARQLLEGHHTDKGEEHFGEARRLLVLALKAPRIGTSGDRLDARIYQALIQTCEWLDDLPEARKYCDMWRRAHPSDAYAASEHVRLRDKRPRRRRELSSRGYQRVNYSDR